ncbi:hypothetical protein F4804DRAFT_307574 [Jackrogersella minutella]|nr:hypothetical protein F4804DRAFT_307574 [Jackrogersella minutella]
MQSYHYDIAPGSNKGKEPIPAGWSTSSQPFPYQRKRPISHSTIVRPQAALTNSRSLGTLDVPGRRSSTWTSSSCDRGLLSEHDEVDNREEFVNEYNRLAKKYGIRSLVPGDFPVDPSVPIRKTSWFSKALRRSSSGQSTQTVIIKSDQQQLRRRRSISDAALNLVHHPKKEGLENANVQDLVRLCGKSLFYLPPDYTPCSLVLPTCLRALAQALVQQADTRGLFRIPGSVRVVNTLYNYYCADRDTNNISATTRSPNLPAHIKFSAHDVASTFKKILAGLSGGILGSLSLFDALVAIHSQLHADPELTKTKESRLRARLIALSIGSVKSQYQRELICAVFGLLCFIGRAAENAPREDEEGRPLPTTDLMGYNALGIVFGPLLISDLINSYKMKVADPAAGLVLLPVSPPKSRKERHKHRQHRHKSKHKCKHHRSKTSTDGSASLYAVDKIHVANSITEMLIVNWREVVRQMRSLGSLKIRRCEGVIQHKAHRPKLSSSASDTFSSRKPPDWDNVGPSHQHKDRSVSPMATSPTQSQLEPPSIKRRRSRRSNSGSSCRSQSRVLGKCLSPTIEESPLSTRHTPHRHEDLSILHDRSPLDHVSGSEMTFHSVRSFTPEINDNGRPKVRDHREVNPADKWKALSLASRASTECLARAAKERRLRRSPGNGFFRHSEECLERREKKQTTPEWKRQLMNMRNGEKLVPARLSPEKKSIFEQSPQSESPLKHGSLSPSKSELDRASRPGSQRSNSRPMNGSVKAMTALFDNAAKVSPDSSTVILTGKTGRGSKEPSIILSPYSMNDSPPKSVRSEASPAASEPVKDFDYFRGDFRPSGTPTHDKQFTQVPLRPTGNTYSASRKTPRAPPTTQVPLRDRELSQPPRLGTMVPHLEEPPVAQHITFTRPLPSTSPTGHYESGDERALNGSPRPRSSNSMLHTQIRHLQRQLECRREENTQLRRQLEARENMDIGKLCEQLRMAKREGKMWRARAEAAEKRVAVFKQFTARLRGIRDSVALEENIRDLAGEGQVDGQSHGGGRQDMLDGSVFSSYSEHTENQEEVKERIRRNMKKRATARGGVRSHCEDGGSWKRGGSVAQQKVLWEKDIPSSRTAQLWDIAEELLMLDGGVEGGGR